MKKIILFLSLVLLFIFSVQNINAAIKSWELDTAHSNFYFSVDHIFSKVNGHFDAYSGEIAFDPNDLENSKMAFTIKVKSINTNNGKRDKHLLSKDFFDAQKFPTLIFVSSKITKTSENHYDVHGMFTVKGESYDLVIPLELVGIKDHPMEKNKEVAGFSGRLTIDRLAYGIGTGKFVDYGVVGKDVDIFISLEVLSNK